MKPELHPDHASWRLPGPVDEWLSSLPIVAASALANCLEDGTATVDGNVVRASATALASWSDAAASTLGLPPPAPWGLDLRLSGAMGRPGASITCRWLQPGRTVPDRGVARDGAWLRSGDDRWRLRAPLPQVLSLVEEFNQCSGDYLDVQFRHWARIRSALGEQLAAGITDGFLRSFRVVSATALTFSISADPEGNIQIDPVLLAQRPAPDGEELEYVRALTEVDEAIFPARVDQLPWGASAFPIGQGVYVVVDEALCGALAAVKALRRAPPAERKRAAMHPEAVLRELQELPDDAPTVFVETERFSERVRDLGDWSPPVLPWIRIDPQQWGAPSSMGVRIDGVDVPLDMAGIDAAMVAMREAIAANVPVIRIADQPMRVSAANLKALEALQRACRNRSGSGEPAAEESGQQVLIIETNLEETSFCRTGTGPRSGSPVMPEGVRTRLKPHQEEGVRWLQRHWSTGSSGVLLCDDMGLGKTLQALAFLRWLFDQFRSGALERRPLLVVAPVGLLRNWEAEIQVHLDSTGLGTLVRAYGDHLRTLRRGRHLDGTAGLDTAALARADIVLANYEAVSDYQLSFGRVPFGALVLDEAQRIKSPNTRVTHAVKGLNSWFVIAMTGTPVENRLADLWCLADAVQPGALPDLKEFSARYEKPGADVSSLREKLWHRDDTSEPAPPRMLLRRLKTERLEGLPPRSEHVLRRSMPARQTEAYERALAIGQLSGPEGTLGMIHALRRVSLHPALLDGLGVTDDFNMEDSARMAATLEVLDRVAEAGEKALVFLESLDLQDADHLPTVLLRRYGLARLPMVINGQVGTEGRQARVDAFQKESGFDVMLLSPKAGGVGLTLTAANHVVHLSRWWNPAVEDQCSDRVYRIGQTRPVHVYYPLAVLPGAEESSFDVQLQKLMDRKRTLAQSLLAAPAFTKADYEALLAATRPRSRNLT